MQFIVAAIDEQKRMLMMMRAGKMVNLGEAIRFDANV
jgi:hypothetical protein